MGVGRITTLGLAAHVYRRIREPMEDPLIKQRETRRQGVVSAHSGD
jgi:hypothetical protein